MAHLLIGNSGQTVKSAPTSILGTKLQGLPLLAYSPLPPLGTSLVFSTQQPPYQPLVPCDTQAPPELNGPLAHGPADGSR
jgi:hypothetical protein